MSGQRNCLKVNIHLYIYISKLKPVKGIEGLIIIKMSLERKTFFRLTRGVAGVAVRSLVEICIDDISAVLRATDLRLRLPFVSCAGLMHLIL
jgi:hypothetical protein